jgi:hypothetical protein
VLGKFCLFICVCVCGGGGGVSNIFLRGVYHMCNYFFQLLNVHGGVVLGRLKCIQPSHLCQRPVPQRLRVL